MGVKSGETSSSFLREDNYDRFVQGSDTESLDSVSTSLNSCSVNIVMTVKNKIFSPL